MSFRESRISGRGQSLVEYGVILALVLAVSIGAIGLFGETLGTLMNDACTTISNTIAMALSANS